MPKAKLHCLTIEEQNEVIEMAWCDQTSFDAIHRITGLREAQVIRLMRRALKASSFRCWRKRVSGRMQKHEARK